MKICWDSLETIKYNKKTGNFKCKTATYIIKTCQHCENEYFGIKSRITKYCDTKCKVSSKEWRKKQSLSQSGENSKLWKGGRYITLYDTYAHQISYCEEVRKNKNNSNILEVKCTYCGKWFIPTLDEIKRRIGALEGIRDGESRLYCSTQCKQECPIYHKIKYQVGHPKANYKEYVREVQPELRQMCFERDNFTCQKCGLTQDELDVGLHCHHVEGIRWEPLESADLDKVITFCKTCHKEIHKLPDCGYNDMRCNNGGSSVAE